MKQAFHSRSLALLISAIFSCLLVTIYVLTKFPRWAGLLILTVIFIIIIVIVYTVIKECPKPGTRTYIETDADGKRWLVEYTTYVVGKGLHKSVECSFTKKPLEKIQSGGPLTENDIIWGHS